MTGVRDIVRGDGRLAGLGETAMTRGGAIARAFERLCEMGLPHRRIESFRWSDVSAAFSEPLERADEYRCAFPEANLAGTERALHLVMANGLVHEMVRPRPSGVRLFLDADGTSGAAIEGAPLALLAVTLSEQTLRIEINQDNEIPVILIDHVIDHQKVSGSRVVFVLRDGARAHVIERYRVVNDASGGHFVLNEFGLQQGAQLQRTVLQYAAQKAVVSKHSIIHAAGENSIRQTTLAGGARLARLETGVLLKGENSRVQMNAAYRLLGDSHGDITTRIQHAKPDSVSEQIIRGVVCDQARGAFQGRIEVARDAQKTDARMRHDALLFSDRGEVNAKPELEIYADDVQCAHGNTVGALDDRALFYMRQRGIPEIQARAMLTEAFIDVALEGLDEAHRPEALHLLSGASW
jgi:Fe-S cluster assembly protein SufD